MAFSYSQWFNSNVDPRLLDVLRKAAQDFPYDVVATSGRAQRKSGTIWHPTGRAIDVQLINPDNGKKVPHYQSGEAFRTYEEFAQRARAIQQAEHPDLDKKFRWGGYFSGRKKYGALDLMHFDIGGNQVPMGGGSWDNGLSPAQRKLWPTAQSVGMANQNQLAQVGVSPAATTSEPVAQQANPMSQGVPAAPIPTAKPADIATAQPAPELPATQDIMSKDPIYSLIQRAFPEHIAQTAPSTTVAKTDRPASLVGKLASAAGLETGKKSPLGLIGKLLGGLGTALGGEQQQAGVQQAEAPVAPDISPVQQASKAAEAAQVASLQQSQAPAPDPVEASQMTPEQLYKLRKLRESAGLPGMFT